MRVVGLRRERLPLGTVSAAPQARCCGDLHTHFIHTHSAGHAHSVHFLARDDALAIYLNPLLRQGRDALTELEPRET